MGECTYVYETFVNCQAELKLERVREKENFEPNGSSPCFSSYRFVCVDRE